MAIEFVAKESTSQEILEKVSGKDLSTIDTYVLDMTSASVTVVHGYIDADDRVVVAN